MNLALSDEQEFLREAAKGALSRFKTVEAARDALEGKDLPDLWTVAKEAGWPGLLVSEDNGGAGLGVFDALLVAEETGRVLASVPFLGVLPATLILDAAGHADIEAIASGETRVAYVPARPPSQNVEGWTVEAASGKARPAAPSATVDGDSVTLSGTVAWVPDAPLADLLVVVGVGADGAPVAAAVPASAASVEPVSGYDATRAIAHVTLDGAQGTLLDVDTAVLERAWYLAHAILAAEAIGTIATTLDMSVQYAKERFTFGRAIGSYQAVKHEITEVLRQLENARSLQFYAGFAGDSERDEFALAASAFRSAAGTALDYAARSNINVHGGIGATWEHDAPLYFRRAQFSRRLLGGNGDATDRVADELLKTAGATA